jgi:hypothetical protein
MPHPSSTDDRLQRLCLCPCPAYLRQGRVAVVSKRRAEMLTGLRALGVPRSKSKVVGE